MGDGRERDTERERKERFLLVALFGGLSAVRDVCDRR